MKSILKKQQNKNGYGIFTTVTISPKSVVFEFKGNLLSKENLNLNSPFYLQIDKNKFLGPSGDYDDYINHSCNPNCGLYIVNNRAFLYSIYEILPNTEITFDYSTSCNLSNNEWSMTCNCGQFNCRKIISGWQYLPDKIKNYYLKLDYVAKFLK